MSADVTSTAAISPIAGLISFSNRRVHSRRTAADRRVDSMYSPTMYHRFWKAKWADKAPGGFDTAQGRDRVVEALRQLLRNEKRGLPWYTDIEIIQHSKS